MREKKKLSIFYGIISSLLFFILLGSISAVFSNPFFTRMTEVGFVEWSSLILTSILIGIYVGLFHFIVLKIPHLSKCGLSSNNDYKLLRKIFGNTSSSNVNVKNDSNLLFIKKNNLGKCNLIATSGGVLGFLTFGCSICNQLLVLILGVSGVLIYFEPIRPILGILSTGFLIYANLNLIKIIKK